MRTRDEIEHESRWSRYTNPYADDTNSAVNLNLENVMQNQGLIIEILLDIRDSISGKGAAE